jgi:porin
LRHTTVIALLFCSTCWADGYEVSATYTADVLAVVSGGLSTGAEYLDNLDLELEIDTADAWGVGGGNVFFHVLYNNGKTFSEDHVGDLQVVSNIDAEEALRLFELWYEFGDEDWSVKTGLYDLNSEFDVNEAGRLFLNSSHGIGAEFGQTGQNGPGIFPVSALSVRGERRFESLTARFAVLDAVPGDPNDSSSNAVDLSRKEGALSVLEIDVPYRNSARLWLGYWRYSAAFERLDGNDSRRGNDGWYIGTEGEISFGKRSAEWFIRYAQAEEQLNRLSGYIGLGAVITGPLAGRPADALGIAVASGRAGEPYRDYLRGIGEAPARSETSVELTYRLQVSERLQLQPDIQYVRSPSVLNSRDDAWVIGCRVQLSY